MATETRGNTAAVPSDVSRGTLAFGSPTLFACSNPLRTLGYSDEITTIHFSPLGGNPHRGVLHARSSAVTWGACRHVRRADQEPALGDRMIALLHGSLEPLLYGGLIFLGLTSLWWKFKTGRWLGLAVEVCVFWLVFSLHGGTVTGGMAATVAALLSGIAIQLFGGRR